VNAIKSGVDKPNIDSNLSVSSALRFKIDPRTFDAIARAGTQQQPANGSYTIPLLST